MHKRKIIAGILFAAAATLFWVTFEFFYGKAETLEAGLSSALAAFITGALFMPKLVRKDDKLYRFSGVGSGLIITASSLLLGVIFLALFKACIDLISIYNASQSPLVNYFADPLNTLLMFSGAGLAAGPLLLIVASTFGALAGWSYVRVARALDGDQT